MTDHYSQHECIGGANVTNALITNRLRDYETNNADRNYDGGDCCFHINTDHYSNFPLLLEMESVMMGQTMLTVIMMVEIAVLTSAWFTTLIAYVIMKKTVLLDSFSFPLSTMMTVTMMVETVVSPMA